MSVYAWASASVSESVCLLAYASGYLLVCELASALASRLAYELVYALV